MKAIVPTLHIAWQCQGRSSFSPRFWWKRSTCISGLDDYKNAIANIPYGGGKGGIKVDPKTLNPRELERLTRNFVRRIAPIIGVNTDVPAPDVNTNAQIMSWIADEYSTLKGEWSPVRYG